MSFEAGMFIMKENNDCGELKGNIRNLIINGTPVALESPSYEVFPVLSYTMKNN